MRALPGIKAGIEVDLAAVFCEVRPNKTMALISCPECGKQVSTVAKACPGCGFPVAEQGGGPLAGPAGKSPATAELLAEVRPSWWNFFWHWVFFFLIVPPLVAWYRRASIVLRVFSGRITIERGVFSKCYQDYLPRDIRSIDIDQGILARMVGIGDLTISTAATVDAAERIEGVPNPASLRDRILAERKGQ